MQKSLFSMEEVAGIVSGRIQNVGSAPGVFPDVCGASIDTRTLRPGDLFVALGGETSDGHRFLADAAKSGAAAALVLPDYKARCDSLPEGLPLVVVDDPLGALWSLARRNRLNNSHVKVIGVTGSNGKTTVKEMTASILVEWAGRDSVVKNMKSFNNHIGVPLTLMELNKDHRFCVAEIGMNAPGEILELAGLARPDVGIITSLGEAHLEGVGTIAGVAEAKAELFRQMASDKKAVLPEVNEDLMKILMNATAHLKDDAKIVFGRSENARAKLLEVRFMSDTSLFCRIALDEKEIQLRLPLPGLHNALNGAAAAAAAFALSVDFESIQDGLEKMTVPEHRSSVIRLAGAVVLDDCYNANPASMTAGLETLSALAGKERSAVILGDMLELGESSELRHRELGVEVASRNPDLAVFVGERMKLAAAGAKEAGMEPGRIHVFSDAAEAGEFAAKNIGEGWRVLVKGSRRVALEKALDAWAETARKAKTDVDSVSPGRAR